jgi:hypothetical protein
MKVTPGTCTINVFTAVIYGFRNKLECLSLNTRLGWKGLPGTNTPAYYGNRKLRPKKFYHTGAWCQCYADDAPDK